MKWLNMGTNVSTITTALVALLTLLIIKNQNEFSYRADIYPRLKYESLMFSYDFDIYQGDHLFKDPKTQVLEIPITLSNIGFSASKLNQIKWHVNYNSIIEEIKNIDSLNEIFVNYDKDKQFFTCENVTGIDKENEKIDFILPVSQEKTTTNIHIPRGYTNLWLNLMARTIQGEQNADMAIEKINIFFRRFASFSFTISYEDILHIKYKKEYMVIAQPWGINLVDKNIYLNMYIDEVSNHELMSYSYFINDTAGRMQSRIVEY